MRTVLTPSTSSSPNHQTAILTKKKKNHQTASKPATFTLLKYPCQEILSKISMSGNEFGKSKFT